MKPWTGTAARTARQRCMQLHGYTCWLCGQPITDINDYTVDHVIPRSTAPELTWDPTNWRPAHGRKHPELNCPGNKGRGNRAPTTHTTTRTW